MKSLTLIRKLDESLAFLVPLANLEREKREWLVHWQLDSELHSTGVEQLGNADEFRMAHVRASQFF